jgi:hypothetical protein
LKPVRFWKLVIHGGNTINAPRFAIDKNLIPGENVDSIPGKLTSRSVARTILIAETIEDWRISGAGNSDLVRESHSITTTV